MSLTQDFHFQLNIANTTAIINIDVGKKNAQMGQPYRMSCVTFALRLNLNKNKQKIHVNEANLFGQ